MVSSPLSQGALNASAKPLVGTPYQGFRFSKQNPFEVPEFPPQMPNIWDRPTRDRKCGIARLTNKPLN